MKILITGASGFIGDNLLRRLAADGAGHEPLAPRRSELDLADESAVEKYLRRHRPEKIVHLAASIARGEDGVSRRSQWRNTFTAGRILVEQAAAAGVAHLLLAGTVAELGDQGGALPADLPAAPRSTYGLCKTLVMECARFTARVAPVRIDGFRPFTVYGPGQTGTMLVPAAFAAAAGGTSADFTDGLQLRDFLYIDDLIDWLALALQVMPSGRGEFQLHHVGTGTGTPVREVLAAIAAEFPGARFNLGAIPRRPEEPLSQTAPADPSLDGWSPRTAWRGGLAKTAAFWRSQGR